MKIRSIIGAVLAVMTIATKATADTAKTGLPGVFAIEAVVEGWFRKSPESTVPVRRTKRKSRTCSRAEYAAIPSKCVLGVAPGVLLAFSEARPGRQFRDFIVVHDVRRFSAGVSVDLHALPEDPSWSPNPFADDLITISFSRFLGDGVSFPIVARPDGKPVRAGTLTLRGRPEGEF